MVDAKSYDHSTVILVNKIRGEGKKVHVKNISQGSTFKRLPADYASTSAWFWGEKYGNTYRFSSNNIYSYNKRDANRARSALRQVSQMRGVDWDLVNAASKGEASVYSNTEVNKMNLIQWIMFAEYLEQRNLKYERRNEKIWVGAN
jgi:hypothetical protein